MSDNMTHNSEASFGYRPVAPEDRQGLVNQVFARVANRYDLMNDLMSAGVHRLWKNDLINWLAPSRNTPQSLLDVAGGTGDVASRFLNAAHAESQVTICDISNEMLEAGRDRHEADFGDRLRFIQGNAENLPFPDRSFDAYTIAFGIRNVTNIDAALSEAHRVLKRGGRFICLEFSEVQTPVIDKIYDALSFNVIPRLGEMVAKDGESYRYLVESIRRFPKQDHFAEMIRKAGFERVQYRNLSSGIAALHSGWRL